MSVWWGGGRGTFRSQDMWITFVITLPALERSFKLSEPPLFFLPHTMGTMLPFPICLLWMLNCISNANNYIVRWPWSNQITHKTKPKVMNLGKELGRRKCGWGLTGMGEIREGGDGTVVRIHDMHVWNCQMTKSMERNTLLFPMCCLTWLVNYVGSVDACGGADLLR